MTDLVLKVLNKLLSIVNLSLFRRTDLIRDDKYLDAKEYKYILWLDRIYSKIQTVPGHIVELGVARGRNSLLFSNMIHMNGDEEVRRYYGFDTFNGYTQDDMKSSKWLNPNAWKNSSYGFVKKRVRNAGYAKTCKFIQGDLKETLPIFLSEGADGFANDSLSIALLYVDCNAYLPALAGMEILKEYMAPGGIICIDEKQQGGETKALIEFCKKYNFEFRKDSSPFSIPAYTIVR